MKSYSLTHVPDHALLCGTRALVSQERVTLADLLAHLAETDSRRLYAPAGYDSMFAWCVGDLRLSEDAAYKRIQAARARVHAPFRRCNVAGERKQQRDTEWEGSHEIHLK